jgi:homoserine kinase
MHAPIEPDGSLEGAEISVPASIANLGPGFDALAVAVQLYLRVKIRAVSPSSRNQLEFEFPGGGPGGVNLIESAFRYMSSREGADFPSLNITVESDIPLRSGLGSSAAAIVAGLRLWEKVNGGRARGELLSAACKLEGHPDNVAAALLGGLTASCMPEQGDALAVSFAWPSALRFVVATPALSLETGEARKVLPQSIARADAVFNLQRMGLLLYSLQSGNRVYLREAMRDRWHQPYRQSLVPGLAEALRMEHPDLLGVCLSGSGPSIALLGEKNFDVLERLLAALYRKLGVRCVVRTLQAVQPLN